MPRPECSCRLRSCLQYGVRGGRRDGGGGRVAASPKERCPGAAGPLNSPERHRESPRPNAGSTRYEPRLSRSADSLGSSPPGRCAAPAAPDPSGRAARRERGLQDAHPAYASAGDVRAHAAEWSWACLSVRAGGLAGAVYGWEYSDIRRLTHSGCLMFTARNSAIVGFRSVTGVPETASRPTTVSSRPWPDSMAQHVTPMRLGPRGPRPAKTPTGGARGCGP